MADNYNPTPAERIDNAIRFICTHTEGTAVNTPEFKRVTEDLFALKDELKVEIVKS